jgi:hypothetical protein
MTDTDIAGELLGIQCIAHILKKMGYRSCNVDPAVASYLAERLEKHASAVHDWWDKLPEEAAEAAE